MYEDNPNVNPDGTPNRNPNGTITDPTILDLVRSSPEMAALERRRKIALKLLQPQFETYRGDAGVIAPWEPGSSIGNALNHAAGSIALNQIDEEAIPLAERRAQGAATAMTKAGIDPGMAQAIGADESLGGTITKLYDARLDSQDRLAGIAQRAEDARQRSEDRRLSLEDRQAARAESMALRQQGMALQQQIAQQAHLDRVSGRIPQGYMIDPKDNTRLTYIPGGPHDPQSPNFKPPAADTTESERTAAGFLGRMIAANEAIDQFGEDAYPGLANDLVPNTGVAGVIKRVSMSPKQQQFQQLADDWTRAKLRKESGAVIGPVESYDEFTTYLPRYGDSKEVLAQKRQARAQAIEQMRTGAGRAKPTIAPPVAPKDNSIRANVETKFDTGQIPAVPTVGSNVKPKPTAAPAAAATEWKEGDHGEIDGQRFVIRNGKPEVY